MERYDPRLALTAKARAQAFAKKLEKEPAIIKMRDRARDRLMRRKDELASAAKPPAQVG